MAVYTDVAVEDLSKFISGYEIGELLSGTAAGRSNDHEITLYRSVGVAVQDAAAAGLVLRGAQEHGVGSPR